MRPLLTALFLAILHALVAAPATEAEVAFPKPFVSAMHERHDGDFYDRQAADWQAFAKGGCATPESWFHYYKTAHYSNRFGSGDYDLDAILAAAEKELPADGFERHYLRFANDADPATKYDHLLAAYAADPDRHEAYSALIGHYEITGRAGKRNDLLRRFYQADPLPTGVMEYNYNQLQSVGPGGILLTNGDADTYPTWMLQTVHGIRPDVTVLNYHLLRGFRAHLNDRLLRLGASAYVGPEDSPPALPALIAKLRETDRAVYFATTTQNQLSALPPDRLYLTGLALRYSETEVENLHLINAAYRVRWRLDALRQPLDAGPAQAVADQLNQNYLPALFELRELNERQPGRGLEGVTALIKTIAKRAGVTDDVDAYLSGNTIRRLASKQPGLRAKDIYKGIVYVPAGPYYPPGSRENVMMPTFMIQEAEVSHGDYQRFLEDLLRQRRFDLLDSVAIDDAQWEEVLVGQMKQGNAVRQLNGADPAFARHPVTNVSHRAARLYAQWLAEAYNQDEKRKDGRNVRFRLPREREFAYAAAGGKVNAPYPWGGPYHRNLKGCLLANFNTLHPESVKELADYREKVL